MQPLVSEKLLKLRTNLFICFSLVFVLCSCELEMSDRVFNEEPGRPKAAIVHISGVDTSKSYAGNIAFEFHVDSIDFPVKRVDCLLDNAPFTSWTRPPYRISIDTRRYFSGKHNFTLAFLGSGQGLVGAQGYYSAVRSFPVKFNQSPPEPVNVVSLEWVGTHPKVTWNKCRSSNFSYYILENKLIPSSVVRDTFYSVSDTTFVDSTITKAIGIATASYSVKVSNSVDAVSGNTVSLGFGQQLQNVYVEGYFGRRRFLIPGKRRPEIYYYDAATSTFTVFSTTTRAQLHSVRIPNVQDMRLREEEDSLFICTSSARSFYKFSPLTRVLDSITNSQGAFICATFVLGRNNRGYFSGYGLQTIQLSPWKQLSYAFHEGHYFPRYAEITSDKNALYHVYDSNNMLFNLDVRTDTPRIVAQYPASSPVALALSENTNEVVLALTDRIAILNAATLQLKRTIQFSEGSGYTVFLTHLEVTDEYMYVSYSLLSQAAPLYAVTSGKILKIRKSDWSVQGSWLFRPFVHKFVVLPVDRQIYGFSYDHHSWIIDID